MKWKYKQQVMQTFTFIYQGQEHTAEVEHFTIELTNRFRIFTEKETFVMGPTMITGELLWLQSDGGLLKHDYVQAIGEGLEAAGIY